MKKKVNNKRVITSWLMLGFLLIFSLGLGLLSSSKPTTSTKTRAATVSGNTITVSGTSGDALQQAIDSAKEGDTVMVPTGVYSGARAVPLGLGDGPWSRGASSNCFIRIEGKKNITIKGQGFYTMIFGEGHDKPDTYGGRAGICVINSGVTFDNVHIKEFQGRCMIVYDSAIVYKNGVVDGCDSGGVSLLGNSTGLFVNNLIAEMNFGGIMLWQNAQAKIINNTFFNGGMMFFYQVKNNDQIHAEIINNIIVSYTNFGGRASITQVEWWKDGIPRLKDNTVKTNLFWKGEFTCWDIELCDFPGKISADPQFVEPVTDPRGIANWANFGVKEGSPVIGGGDPSIPGPNNLGHTGGPCADGNSSICTNFIAQNMPKPYEQPAPTEPPPPIEEPTEIPPDDAPPDDIVPPPVRSSSSSRPPSDLPIGDQRSTSLFIIENMGFGTLTIQGIQLKNNYVPLNKKVETGEAIEYPLSNACKNTDETLQGSVLYTDEKGKLSFPSLTIYCNKNNVFDIQ